MLFFLLALVTAVVGVVPLLLGKKFSAAGITGVVYLLLSWWIYYYAVPSLVWPVFGGIGILTVVFAVISAIIVSAMESDYDGNNGLIFLSWVVPGFGILAICLSCIAGCSFLRTNEYANLIGPVEQREWTKDVQPKDPAHVRLVPPELAFYLATKQLGEAQGAVGSQFEVIETEMTLQMVKNELWYVAPLEYRGYAAWTSAQGSPGYVMVHGEDPKRQVIVHTGEQFKYMPSAWFSEMLDRYIWTAGYYDKGLSDYTFELDDDLKPFWTVTIFRPTIMWWGRKATGVLVVDPVTGQSNFHPLGNVPTWIDRVIPNEMVKSWIKYNGLFSKSWWNSVWAHENVIMPENPSIVYGSDGQPLWTTCVTSSNGNDKSMVGVYYTSAHTGKTVRYHAIGGTEEAVLELVNNKVAYRKLHGSSPVLYNIYGVMTSIVPILGESHTFQGVAFVDVANMQVAVGDTLDDTFTEYQKIITTSAQSIAPEAQNAAKTFSGTVDRVKGEAKTYFIHIKDVPRIFRAAESLSPKLVLTQIGDEVVLRFIESNEDVITIIGFDNVSLPLDASKTQEELRQRVQQRRSEEASQTDIRQLRGELQNMSDEQLRKLLEASKKQK